MSEEATHYGASDTAPHKTLEINGIVGTIKKSVYEQGHDRTTLTLVFEELDVQDSLRLTEIERQKTPVRMSLQTTEKKKRYA